MTRSVVHSASPAAFALVFGVATALASAAQAGMPPDTFPLGQSAKSGAVCEAQRNDDDPAAQLRGARAWDVHCRGWDAPLGRLYAYGFHGAQVIGPKGLWTRTLAGHAACAAPSKASVAGLGGVQVAQCKAFSAKIAYLAYTGQRGGEAVAAEGFANLADVLEVGLKVTSGAARPPKATQLLSADTGGQATGGLASAAEAASAAPENLRERGYNRNLAWRFADAETDFAQLAQNASAPAQIRAEAYLNWALNTSNLGRFSRADALFAEADKLTGADANLRAELLSYRALHLRNEKRFAEAIIVAEQARALFFSLAPATDSRGARPQVVRDTDGALVIGPQLASELRSRTAFAAQGLDPGARARVQVAQTYLTQATAERALGDSATSRRHLENARAILADPGLSRIAVWLRVQVDSELARQDQNDARPGEARQRLAQALVQLSQREAGSPAEAYLVMELARAEALAGDQPGALRDFQQAIAMFKSTRGSLGASADSADAYFSLLLARNQQEPNNPVYADRFLSAAESLGSEATADTIARLSARLNQSDSAAAGLIRALEDTRRQVRLKEGEIAQLQAQSGYTPPVAAARQAELKALNAEASELEAKVAASDPRYGQLVSSDVSLKALQAKLKPGEMFVKVVLLDQGGYGIAVEHDGAQPYRIDLTAADAQTAVTALRKPFEATGYLPRYDVAASYKMFQTLFGPVQDRLLKADHVIYEPDPLIISLPIAALATDQKSVDLVAERLTAIRAKGEGVLNYAGVDWLGHTARLSLAVSAASFAQARDVPPSPAKKPFLGFGDSVQPSPGDPRAFTSVVNRGGAGSDVASAVLDDEVCRATRQALLELKPLKEATSELDKVGASLGATSGSIVTGEAFSDGRIEQRSDLDQYRVLYFATHGLLPQPGGCLPEPALLTSVDDRLADSDGLLSASKILGLKLDADLVVLSACDTGGGVKGDADNSGLGGAGEALGGLTRAFIYAGARSLVVSHWQIDSDATVRLMTAMFDSGVPTLGGALRQAESSLMASPDQYSHPYYWAAFTVVGDGGRPMPAR